MIQISTDLGRHNPKIMRAVEMRSKAVVTKGSDSLRTADPKPKT